MNINTLTLPIDYITEITALDDPAAQQAMHGILQQVKADPEAIRPEDYADHPEPVRKLVDFITKRVDTSRRRAEAYRLRKEQKANEPEKEPEKETENEPAPRMADPSKPDALVDMRDCKKYLWFNGNFRQFVDNTLSVIRAIKTEEPIFEALAEGLDEICAVISAVIGPMASSVAANMRLPRHSRPRTIPFYPTAPMTAEELRLASRVCRRQIAI